MKKILICPISETLIKDKMSSEVGSPNLTQTNSKFLNSTSVTDDIICGVDCKCSLKQKTASQKTVPGYDYVGQVSDGRGKFGRVQLYRNNQTKAPVAIKEIPFVSRGRTIYHEVKSEVNSAMSISHENIAKYYDFFVIDKMKMFVVMEYTIRGSLRKLLIDQIQKNWLFKQNVVLQIIHDVIIGMQVLNSYQIVHCDLKPENILVGDNGRMKICDFGTAHKIKDKTTRNHSTVSYMAPELFEGAMPDELTEIWALGVIFYEICTFTHPFEPYASERELIKKIKAALFRSLNCRVRGYSYDMQELLEFMLQSKTSERQSLSKIRSHPLFTPYKTKRIQVI